MEEADCTVLILLLSAHRRKVYRKTGGVRRLDAVASSPDTLVFEPTSDS
jgi:hypothetical protein